MRHFLYIAGRRLAMLLVAVMLIVPVADTFACSAEPLQAHASLDADAATHAAQDDAGDGHAHGPCGHNHCHHNASGLQPDVSIATSIVSDASLWASYDDLHLSGGSDGLLRPPRR